MIGEQLKQIYRGISVILCVSGALLSPALAWSESVDTESSESSRKNPFADEYQIPQATELGTAAGQLRMSGFTSVHFDESYGLGAGGVTELMTTAFVGVRGVLSSEVFRFDEGPKTLTAQFGTGFHLLPYRIVDLSLNLDGGVGVYELGRDATVAPIVTGSLALDVSLTSYFFTRLSGGLSWGVYDRSGRATEYLSPMLRLGLGFQI